MSMARTVGVGAAIALGAPLLVGLGAVGWILASFPAAQGERIRGPHELVGVQAGGSYAWVIPTDGGVVLVDAGFDRDARAVLREIGSRPVKAILLTHAHVDHVRGLGALPAAPVYTADVPLLAGERAPGGWLARWFARTTSLPEPPEDVRPVADGEELRIDGVRVRATAVPGHTPGSIAWLWNDVLFTGDALLGGSPPTLAPPAFADDPALARQNLRNLLRLDFDDLADGHVGLTGAARTALHRELGAKVEPPTISLRVDGNVADAVVERTGVYVEAPAPDARGERPAFLLVHDGPPVRVGDAGDPERAKWVGRSVTVRGRLAGQRMVVEHVERTDAADGEGLPEPDGGPALLAKAGWWVRARGTVRRFAPLQADAAWGEGELELPDGTLVALSAPVGQGVGGAYVGIVRVVRDGERVRLVALPGVDASRSIPQAPL